eukprot:GHVR01100500.1.p1 GENE.GHVR01100500.1~~GHVR01100500.1.p1  ORF type:complete len:142 (-),score=2.34 GHVR01100500.1:263-688(-)
MVAKLNVDDLFETILELFAVTVLLNETGIDCELIEFAHAGVTTNQYLRPDTIFSRDCILEWFYANRDRIKATLKSDHSGTYKASLLNKIEGCDLQRRVISSIFVISVCDFYMDAVGTDFINLVLKTWEGGPPNKEELNAVA